MAYWKIFSPITPAIGIIRLICVIGLVASCSSSPSSNNIPEPIRVALARLPQIKPGTREGNLFQFLGLPKPEEELNSFVEGRSGSTWTRYDLGYGGKYVLECEAANSNKYGWLSFDNGILLIVEIRRLKTHDGDQPIYESLAPRWQDTTDWAIEPNDPDGSWNKYHKTPPQPPPSPGPRP